MCSTPVRHGSLWAIWMTLPERKRNFKGE
jgi:hypothetical protein